MFLLFGFRTYFGRVFFFDKFWNFFRICNLCHIFGCFSAMYSQILMTQGFLDSSHVALSMKNGLNQNRSLQEGFFHRCLWKNSKNRNFRKKIQPLHFFQIWLLLLGKKWKSIAVKFFLSVNAYWFWKAVWFCLILCH